MDKINLAKIIYALVFLMTSSVSSFSQPAISFTFDDGITADMPGYSFEQWNNLLLGHLDDAGIKSVFFVTGSNKTDEKGMSLLKSWNDEGHKIANHTYSHKNYNNEKVTFEIFKVEFLRDDSIIREFENFIPLFRFPYLKEGNTKEKVDLFRSFLKEQNYKNGYVTIDASDWYVNSRLIKRLTDNPDADIEGFRKFYIEHLYDRAVFYEDLSYKLTGRHISHTLLLHHNLTSALFLGDLIRMFRDKGWKIINAEEAFKDEIYLSNPSNIPAGESLIWALAKESGRYDSLLRYPAEDGEYEKDKMDKAGL
ncbi:MAG: polysaccharide deacetylase family protein [Ignavibacteria bacterium]|nr:polysaccharide deacetylase family protein [Ignavibacteria bacterium]